MVEEWQQIKVRIKANRKLSRADYKVMCRLHSEVFNHPYKEPCTCNKKRIRQWISDLDSKLLNKS